MTKQLPICLWNGDAGTPTGFAAVTHGVLDNLQGRWQTPVLGINFSGDHPTEPGGKRTYPYPMYVTYQGGDLFGLGRMGDMIDATKPDVVVVQNDVWNVREFMWKYGHRVPLVGFMPVDGLNCRGKDLNGLACGIFYTEFARQEAIAGGYRGPSEVVPLGIDLAQWAPGIQKASRDRLGISRHLPQDVFIVGNVNRNQPRKRIDLTIRYFCRWIAETKTDDAYLLLHMAPTGDRGWDLDQLMSYYLKHFFGAKAARMASRLIVTSNKLRLGVGLSTSVMQHVYRAMDVQLTTTQGEGWGLTTMEGMASGIPQIVPSWAALAEWATAAVQIPCTSTAATPNEVNAIGGIADEDATIAALDKLYADPLYRRERAAAGRALVQKPEYRWSAIADRFDEILTRVVAGGYRRDTVAEAA